RTTTTNLTGEYALSLAPATYRILAYDPQGTWATSFYNEASSFETSAEIVVAAGATISSINFRLRAGLKIQGTVATAANVPLANMVVSVYNLDGTRRGHQKTNASGQYVITVPAGQYKVVAWDDELLYAPEFYANARSFSTASTITVNANVVGIDFSLDVGARVSGRVLAEETGQPLSGIEVSAYAVSGERIAFVATRAGGDFSFSLPSGRYKFSAADPTGKYVMEFYFDVPTFAAAASFELTAGQTQSGLNFTLALQTQPSAPTTLFIPAVINTPGAENSFWRTDVWIYNPSQGALTITAAYLTGTLNPAERTITIPSKGQVEIANVVERLFGAGGLGAIRLSAPSPFVAVSRTFNTPPNASTVGTFGFSIAAMEKSRTMGRAVLPGISQGTTARTNIGIMNPHEHPITVAARLHSSGGAVVGNATVTIAPLSVQQPSVALLFGSIELAEGYVVLSSEDGSFFSYASVVDNKSGDPTLVLPSAGE
ncbi:MAG TPA: carboxypeptidase-like regulatory domain-containing protein, partial [Thermoanaerobaculia bacterium]|nr:carboxypeptidase-like regulatory domain-containing protein [Thermoanaerobaculia bacterium]